MIKRHPAWPLVLSVLVLGLAVEAAAQAKGVKIISAAEMKPHMAFLGAKEFRGRSAPSTELDIASKYLALEAAKIGLQPLMPDGSYFQSLPVEVTTMSPTRSSIRVSGRAGELTLRFPQAFTSSVRATAEWSASGGLVFAGSALSGTQPAAWSDALGDVRGKFVVILDVPVPAVPGQSRPGVLGGPHAPAPREGGGRPDHGHQPGARERASPRGD